MALPTARPRMLLFLVEDDTATVDDDAYDILEQEWISTLSKPIHHSIR